jgi:hypothetical protein
MGALLASGKHYGDLLQKSPPVLSMVCEVPGCTRGGCRISIKKAIESMDPKHWNGMYSSVDGTWLRWPQHNGVTE